MASARKPLSSALVIHGRAVPVRLRINRRAKRLIVRVDPGDGAVVVTAPSQAAAPEALAFAASRSDWIAEQMARAPGRVAFAPGVEAPYRGRLHLLAHEAEQRAPVRRAAGAPPRLIVGGARPHMGRRLEDWMKRQARAALAGRVAEHARAMRRPVKRISIRDPQTRWGSCSAEGALSFSWRLIMAPDHVLDYVAAHECAHLAHMHHGPAFWRAVERLIGDPEPAKAWLRSEGAKVHRYGA